MHHVHIFLSFSECEQAPFWSQGLVSKPSGYFPNTASLLMFYKNGKTAAFCISSPLCDGEIGLSVSLAAFFAVRQLHPAGCVVGVPSVVWELCLQDTTLPGGEGRGDFTHYSSAIWLPSLYHMHLTSFKFWLNEKIMEILPAWVAKQSFCAFCFCVFM